MPSVVATLTVKVATLTVKEDKIEQARSALKQLATETLAEEPGTLAYLFHQQKDDPTRFVAYEKYESDAAFQAHSKNLASKAATFAGILAGPPEILVLEEI